VKVVGPVVDGQLIFFSFQGKKAPRYTVGIASHGFSQIRRVLEIMHYVFISGDYIFQDPFAVRDAYTRYGGSDIAKLHVGAFIIGQFVTDNSFSFWRITVNVLGSFHNA
jgi:hypothetical protein